MFQAFVMSREVIYPRAQRKNHILPSGLGADQEAEGEIPADFTIYLPVCTFVQAGFFYDMLFKA